MPQHVNSEISIVVIDDDKAIADNLDDYLIKKGYSSYKAYTGQQGMELVDAKRPHIALVDFKLPDINGIDLLKSIKTNSPETIVIFITGYATIDAAAEAIRYGAFDFIAKPFKFDELDQLFHRAIETKTKKKSKQLKKRKIILILTIPIWMLLGYLFFRLF